MTISIDEVFVKLLRIWPARTVATTAWLEKHKIKDPRKYIRLGLIKKISNGYYVKVQDSIDWEGGLYSLHSHLKFPIHIGGLSSLSLMGIRNIQKSHENNLYLFTIINRKSPEWFLSYPFSKNIILIGTLLFKNKVGVTSYTINGIKLKVSSLERAAFELIHCIPEYASFEEVDLIFAQLSNLNPTLIQKLLENCQIYKVKRLFLFLCEKYKHPWLNQIDLRRVDLGSSILSFTKGGMYIEKYKIMVPKQLAKDVDDYLLKTEILINPT